MARYEHLPIYKKAMDIAIHFEKVVAGFSRYHKYTLGTDLRDKSRKIVGLIVKANSSQEKLPRLLELREHLDELLILIRLCKCVLAFKSFKSFQFALEQAISCIVTPLANQIVQLNLNCQTYTQNLLGFLLTKSLHYQLLD